jgi:hypothetical protein
VAEQRFVNKPNRRWTQTLADLGRKCLADSFARQGFTSAELVTHWEDIVGRDIATHAEPIKIQWPHHADPDEHEPATLVLRVQGPTALEIQLQSDVILERINSFLGWRAVGRLVLRQAPLMRRQKPLPPPVIDPEQTKRIAATLERIADEDLRAAVARLGAAIKRT